uniref:THUMP domain-containing protein n=1 Tax=Globodera rostochiensis TaxID=31243 RepID=A0A914I8V6_GLORO
MNNLKPGLCGLFFTVDADEKRGVREAFNLIDRFISAEEASDEAANSCNKNAESDGKDVSDSLSSECQQIRQKRQHFASNTIRQFGTGARCSLFFTSARICPANVYKIAVKMVEQSQRESLTRFLARVIPVEETCAANLDQITTLLSEMIAKHLKDAIGGEPPNNASPTYAVDFKASNTKLLKREQIYDLVADLMKKQSPDSAVNLTQPDLLVVVHTIRTVTMLSIVTNYYQLRKFALKLPSEKECKEKSSKETADAEPEGKTEGN